MRHPTCVWAQEAHTLRTLTSPHRLGRPCQPGSLTSMGFNRTRHTWPRGGLTVSTPDSRLVRVTFFVVFFNSPSPVLVRGHQRGCRICPKPLTTLICGWRTPVYLEQRLQERLSHISDVWFICVGSRLLKEHRRAHVAGECCRSRAQRTRQSSGKQMSLRFSHDPHKVLVYCSNTAG